MSHTITVRIPDELASWLAEAAKRTGIPQSQLVRDQLEKAKAKAGEKSFMRLAGTAKGPRDLSSRKGFSRE